MVFQYGIHTFQNLYIKALWSNKYIFIYNTVVGVPGGAVQTKTVMVGSAQIQKYMSCEWYPYMLAIVGQTAGPNRLTFFEEITFHGQCRTL